eukprot:712137-Ditylum_brightwellii.AAC.1
MENIESFKDSTPTLSGAKGGGHDVTPTAEDTAHLKDPTPIWAVHREDAIMQYLLQRRMYL